MDAIACVRRQFPARVVVRERQQHVAMRLAEFFFSPIMNSKQARKNKQVRNKK